MVISRSRGGIAEASARSRVVLPTAVPPQTRMFLRALTTAARNAASWLVQGAVGGQAAREALASRSRRIATHGLPVTAITANSRPPPGSGTLTRGVARSKRRSSFPARVAMARIRSVSSASLPAMGAARTRRPPAYWTNTSSQPLALTDSTSGSSRNGWKPPRPKSASKTACPICRSVAASSGARASVSARAASASSASAMRRRPSSARRAGVSGCAPSGPAASRARRRATSPRSRWVSSWSCPVPGCG